jgi:hypothetical protein
MTGMQREELEALFRYCVRVPDDRSVAGVTRGVWPGWDSMAHVTLVGALEDQFDLVLGIDEAKGLVDWEGTGGLGELRAGGGRAAGGVARGVAGGNWGGERGMRW